MSNYQPSTDHTPVMFITGGSRGIGAATALLAAAAGYDVALTYRQRDDEARNVCAAIEAGGRRALAVPADLADEASIVRAWTAVLSVFPRVSVLVNNAGTLEQQMPLEEMDAARMHRVFAINSIGTMLCAREAVRHMSTARGGCGGVIVNVSSVAARLGAPREYIDYAASKAAVEALTIGLAKEVANVGVRVTAVRAGTVHTEIHAAGGEPDRVARVARNIPLGRGGQPDEIAEAILWLASDRASFVTGSILEVSGGL